MKKLSELPNDAMLCIEHRNDGDIEAMSKEDFLDSAYYLDYPAEPYPIVTVAESQTQMFSLDSIIEMMADEMHEDWDMDVLYELREIPNIAEFEAMINKVLSEYPAYFEGEIIEIDITPDVIKNK